MNHIHCQSSFNLMNFKRCGMKKPGFVLPNGIAYTGYYHIHPTLGAMRGKTHSEKIAHDKLMTPGEHSMMIAKERDASGKTGY